MVSSAVQSVIYYLFPDAYNVSRTISIVIWIAIIGMLKKAFTRLILKEDGYTERDSKLIVYSALGFVLVIFLMFVIFATKPFESDKRQFERFISEMNAACPIKYEEGELHSVQYDDEKVVIDYLLYEYKDVTIKALRNNNSYSKILFMEQLIGSNDKFIDLCMSRNLNMVINYRGNRSDELLEMSVTNEEIKNYAAMDEKGKNNLLLQGYVESLNMQLPISIDEGTNQVKVTLENNYIVTWIELDTEIYDFSALKDEKKLVQDDIKSNIISTLKNEPTSRSEYEVYVKNDKGIKFMYTDKTKNERLEIVIFSPEELKSVLKDSI
jgi:hypothetical protein